MEKKMELLRDEEVRRERNEEKRPREKKRKWVLIEEDEMKTWLKMKQREENERL